MKNLKVILIVFIAGALSLSLEAKKIDLKYTFEKGQEFSFVMTISQEIGQEVMGQIQEMTSDISQTISFKVTDITPEGNYLIEKTIVKFKVVSGSPMGDMEFDSENADNMEAFKETIAAIVDAPLSFVMDPKGNIIEIIELEATAEKFSEMLSGGGPELQMIATMAGQLSSEDGIRQSVEGFLLPYPAEKVKTQKAWESTSTLQQMVNFKNTASTMVNEVNGDIAVLTQEVKIEVGDGDNGMEMEGMEMEYDLSGGKQGSYDVDLKTGLIVKGKGVITISGIISVDSPQLPAPMSIPMSIKTTEKIERL